MNIASPRCLRLLVCAGFGILNQQAYCEELLVKIGHVAPVSGAQAHYGKDNENGARMAIEDLNAKGVMIGGKKAKFELVAEDDAADSKQGAAVAQRLCDAKVNGVVGHLNSGTSIPASKVYNDCGLPNITPSATNPKLTRQGFKTTFRLLANDSALGAGLAQVAADSLKLKRVAVIDDGTAYGQGLAELFKKTAMAKGVQIIDQQQTTDKATDFKAILTIIKLKNPDGVFYGGMDPQAGPMLRQMDQLGMTNVKFLGGDGICTAKLAALSGDAKALASVVCAESGIPIEKTPGGRAWKERYDKQYPGQFRLYSPYTYDATMVLADAMVRAGSADPKVYLPYLQKAEYQGLTAKVRFQPDGEIANPAMTFYTYKASGERVALGTGKASGEKLALAKRRAATEKPSNRTVTTFFATDRKWVPNSPSPKDRFSSEWGDLTYGIATVNIPPGHRMGEIERPSWLLFWQGEDLAKHMVLTSVKVIDLKEYFDRVRGAMDSKVRRAFVFVHGYNVTFEAAALRTAQMAVDLDIRAVPVFYSWPSRGNTKQYTIDEQTAEWTEKHLAEFLERFADKAGADQIFVIAHSLGAQAATRAMASVLEHRADLRARFKELVLAAPDIDARVFKEQILVRFATLRSPVTLYASSKDKALRASVKVHGQRRAGMAGDQIVVSAGVETIDASSIDTDFLGHSYFVTTRPLLTDLALLIGSDMRAATRPTLEGQPSINPSHWAFRP